MPDTYDLWEIYDNERERELEKYPLCDCCREPITDEHLYYIGDLLYCESCMNEEFRKRTEDFMEE